MYQEIQNYFFFLTTLKKRSWDLKIVNNDATYNNDIYTCDFNMRALSKRKPKLF